MDDGSFTVGDISEVEVVIMDDDSKCIGVSVLREDAGSGVLNSV